MLTKSTEDYIEAIYILESKKIPIKSVKIAEMLNVSKPAVNKAMNELKQLGYIEDNSYSDIIFTQEGRKIAKEVYHKHLIIRDFLINLGVPKEIAEIDCCKIEHVVSNETFLCIENFINKK